MKKQQMIEEILAAMKYQDGDYYMGSLAKAGMYHRANVQYPYGNLEEGLNKAEIEIVKTVYDYVYQQGFITHMKKNPTVVCPLCSTTVRETQMKYEVVMAEEPDIFIIQFQPNYVNTLIKTIGLKKAKKRLLEEGTVSLKIQIDKLEK